jgi:hypothetical protein
MESTVDLQHQTQYRIPACAKSNDSAGIRADGLLVIRQKIPRNLTTSGRLFRQRSSPVGAIEPGCQRERQSPVLGASAASASLPGSQRPISHLQGNSVSAELAPSLVEQPRVAVLAYLRCMPCVLRAPIPLFSAPAIQRGFFAIALRIRPCIFQHPFSLRASEFSGPSAKVRNSPPFSDRITHIPTTAMFFKTGQIFYTVIYTGIETARGISVCGGD